MGNQITNLFDKFFSKQVQILMIGLDSAGKTTILYKLKLGEVVSSCPTIGFNAEILDLKNIKFISWDVGNKNIIYNQWPRYFQNVQGLIFVIDSSDKERVEYAKEELQQLLQQKELKDSHVLVFANKQDLGVMNTTDVTEKLGLNDIVGREWFVQGTCAISGDGIFEGFEWLTKNLANKK